MRCAAAFTASRSDVRLQILLTSVSATASISPLYNFDQSINEVSVYEAESFRDSAPLPLVSSCRWQYPLTCRGNQGYVEFMAPALELDSRGRPPPFLPPIQDRPIDVLFSGYGFRVLLPECYRLRNLPRHGCSTSGFLSGSQHFHEGHKNDAFEPAEGSAHGRFRVL